MSTRESLFVNCMNLIENEESDLAGMAITLSNLSKDTDETYSAEDLNKSLIRYGFGPEYHFNTLVDFSTRYHEILSEATTSAAALKAGDHGYKFTRTILKTDYDDSKQTSGWKTIRHSLLRIEAKDSGSGINSSATGEAATLSLKIRIGSKGSQIECYPLEVDLGDTGSQQDIDYIQKNVVDKFNNFVRSNLNPVEISAHVYRLAMEKLSAIALRDRGGIYFVPFSHVSSLVKLTQAVCMAVPRINPILIPILSTDKIGRDSIAESVHSSIIADIEGTIESFEKYTQDMLDGTLKRPRASTITEQLNKIVEVKKRAEQHALALEFDMAVFNDRFRSLVMATSKASKVFQDFKNGTLAVGGSKIDTDEDDEE